MNIGNISPEVIRQLREKYATGISAPKKVKKAAGKKKTVAKKAKPAVGRRRGQPVAAKSPKPPKPPVPTGVAYKPPPSSGNKTVYTAGGSGGIVASQESRDRQAAIVASDLYPEIQRMNRQLNQIRDQEGSPEYEILKKQLFALQDQAAGGSGIPPGSMASIPTPVGSIQPQVMTKGLDGKMYPNPGAAGEANKRFMAQQEQPAPPKAPAPPINIMGPSFDPNERKEYEEKIRSQMSLMPGQNIISQNPVTMNPLSAVPQTQFGGYGAQMPMKALNPYAGMGAANKKVDFFPDYVDAPPKTT